MGALKKQLEDLESKCKTDFECAIEDLPAFIQQLKEEAETALANAEIILGMRQGTVTPFAVEAPPVVMTMGGVMAVPAKKVERKNPVKDEDSLV